MKFKESKSIYLQIADRIMDEILRMVYPEEGRVPSVREYAAMVEVNANTVVRSYDYLQGQEIIYNKRGSVICEPGSPGADHSAPSSVFPAGRTARHVPADSSAGYSAGGDCSHV